MRRSVALITVNPTLDIFFQGEDFSFSKKIFAKYSYISAGGSAINIARGLQRLNQTFNLYIITGGEIGTLVRNKLIKEKMPFCFSENKEETRVVAILSGRKRNMFVTPSPKIDSTTLRKFIENYYLEIANHDLIVMGGSVPEESSQYIIKELVHPLIKQGLKVIVDSRGSFAQGVYKEVPYIIKYNKERTLNTIQRTSKANQYLLEACDLHKRGISLVIYNTDKYCYVIHDNYIWRYPNITQFTNRTYGRGDAFLAGLVSALLDECSVNESIRFAIACGASFNNDFPLGEVSPELILGYLDKIQYDAKRRII